MSQQKPRVLVIGGGLAGLTVAKELASNRFSVTLVERADRVGGKAGSPMWSPFEHGYHIFAPWYKNTRKIVEEELRIKLKPLSKWHYKTKSQGAGGAEGWKTLLLPSTPRQLWEVLSNSPLPIPDTLLYFYFVLDMIGQPLSRKAMLDRISRVGLMRNRWYVTERMPEIETESILKASAVPLYEMSAYTAKILSAYFLRALQPAVTRLDSFPFLKLVPQPSLFILEGDMQQTFINPYAKKAKEVGVDIKLNCEVTEIRVKEGTKADERLIDYVYAQDVHEGRSRGAPGERLDADIFVVTTPLDVTQTLIPVELHRAEPSLRGIQHLRSAPMAALHLALKEGRTPRGLKPEHTFLLGGLYGLSYVELSPHWKSKEPPYISFISSNFAPLEKMKRDEQYELLMEEIGHYLPIRKDDVQYWNLFPNTGPTEKLFINTIGSWPNRPRVWCEKVPNLFFAGDWVKNRIDLACMEGAVSSALEAARRIGLKSRDTASVVVPDGPLVARRHYPPLVRLVVLALAPSMLLVYLWARWNQVNTWLSRLRKLVRNTTSDSP